MGMTPAATISARLLANLGSTRPGQSHNTTWGESVHRVRSV